MAVQFDSVRKVVDAKYLAEANALSDAYYNFWKKGLSKTWRGFDKAQNAAASKTLFDRLHGMIWHKHTLAVIAENTRQGNPYEADGGRSTESQAWLDANLSNQEKTRTSDL